MKQINMTPPPKIMRVRLSPAQRQSINGLKIGGCIECDDYDQANRVRAAIVRLGWPYAIRKVSGSPKVLVWRIEQ